MRDYQNFSNAIHCRPPSEVEFKLCTVPGHGRCLFHCFALSLMPDIEPPRVAHLYLRRLLVAHMVSDLRCLNYARSVGTSCAEMKSLLTLPYESGTEAIIFSFSHLFRKNV